MRPRSRSRNATGDDAIDLAGFAEVMAHLRRFPADKGDEVIARLGIRRRAWQAAVARWKQALDADLAAGSADLTSRYAGVFSRARRRLAILRPSLESLGPLPGPDDAAPAEAPAPPPIPPPAGPLRPQDVTPPAAQPARPSYLVAQPPPRAASPWASYDLTPEIAAPPPIAVTNFPPKHRTVILHVPQAPADDLPFDDDPVSPDQALHNALAHAAAVQGPAPRDPLPFGGTVDASVVAPSAPLPFAQRSPAAERFPGFTVEQYASLRVELHRNPERAAETLARYHVPEGARAALDADWRARFEAEPTLRNAFLGACERYSAWLDAHRPASG